MSGGCRLSEIRCGLGALPASKASAIDEVERSRSGLCLYVPGLACAPFASARRQIRSGLDED
ncbi:MAG: hypothetical protein WAP11_05115 [Acetomicrobium sp.]